jgi:hypothetical protein
MSGVPRYTPLAEFFRAGDGPNNSARRLRACLARADVIVGIDVNFGDEVLVFGRAFLQRLVASGGGGRVAFLVEVGIDGTGDLDKLLRLVRRLRGHHDCAVRNTSQRDVTWPGSPPA